MRIKNYKIHFFIVIEILLTQLATTLHAQLVISNPVNNQILQRDANGSANIAITAYAHFPYSRIEARLIPEQNNIHPGKEFSFSANQIKQGFLYTAIQAETGWYRLEIIGFGDKGIIDSASVGRVGIGEVFLVAGNSNAMGLPDLGAKNTSDQVISYNAVNKILNPENITVAPDEPMPRPVYAPISAKNNIFPSGETSWYWGELGDMISRKMNTPVLFLNAAWAAANSENYRDGAMGKDAFNIYVGKYWPNRQPYTNIVNTLRYFNSSLGLRAVLWSHGENDAQLNFTEENYFNNIKTLIENSRLDSGYPVPWIIAKNSVSYSLPNPPAAITNAQKRLSVLPNFNTYPGPDLDTVQIPRPSQGHFENISGGKQGLTLAATAWNRILTDSLFKTVAPLQPKFAIHTSLVPSKVFPGAKFTLPYYTTGTANNKTVQAELLDETGKFVKLAGTGSGNLVNLQIPDDIPDGRYGLRLSAVNPTLTGSISGYFLVSKTYTKIEFINTISARKAENSLIVSWHVAANPSLKKMILQKTADGDLYSDLASFDAQDNQIFSRIYSYSDDNVTNESVYYRIKGESINGEISYSTILAILKEGTPPNFVVFPNPVTKQQFYLRPDNSETDIQCSIFDIRGREHPIVISDSEVIGLLSLRPVHALPTGNYILKIVSKSGVSTQNVVFQ
ncbi:sialate O-acetylesterase [Dyadobacter subterraneus]|uniref:T9SS type A sorting domain-containing protein n=1 Tax=Dyadobacter subterraneus TaxID=2773304 RepID=A0ABR9WMQ2_9BACT|nr:sialate O-acetylesterase [Dyadobacter subterraneus]MBE9465439.1 T9SS type A sorting domain-containing protein [Dyadobacter subterraneus]